MYLAGLYHRAGRNETTELINLPDITGIEVELDGVNFTLLSGALLEWQRELAFANGELRRSVLWRSPDGKRYRLESRRFVSLAQLPLVAMQLAITPLDGPSQVVLKTGIDATQTNSGRQHLDEISVRVFDQNCMQGVYETQDRVSDVVISAFCRLSAGSESCFTARNRRISAHYSLNVSQGDTVTLEKLVWVAHRTDKALSQASFARNALAELKVCAARGYASLLESSACAWEDVWRDARVAVTSAEPQDQLALDYTVWHLTAMTPADNERCSIAAKGLTGEGYKGHVFWDTEIFLLPFHLFTRPQVARSLLRYRWLNLAGAREKARRNGWPGALFPGRVPRAVRRKRRNMQQSTSARARARKWPLRWQNITLWRTLPGLSWPTGRRHMMTLLCVTKG